LEDGGELFVVLLGLGEEGLVLVGLSLCKLEALVEEDELCLVASLFGREGLLMCFELFFEIGLFIDGLAKLFVEFIELLLGEFLDLVFLILLLFGNFGEFNFLLDESILKLLNLVIGLATGLD
jgi:hypothetical protein